MNIDNLGNGTSENILLKHCRNERKQININITFLFFATQKSCKNCKDETKNWANLLQIFWSHYSGFNTTINI